MTNPNNAVGTNAAYGGRTSVNAFNDDLTIYSRGILSGWACSPKSGMTVQIGGNGSDRDAAVAEDNAGNKTSINNISGSPIDVTIPAAPATNNRIDLIVAYADNPPSGTSTVVDNPAACGIIVVSGTAAASPTAPTNAAIRRAITADGATGSTAYYVILAQIRVGTGVTTIGSGVITQGDVVKSYATAGDETVTTDSIADGAITSDKVDWTTFMTVLYDGGTAGTNATLSLADSVANYARIKVFFRTNDNDPDYGFTEIYSPNNKVFSTFVSHPVTNATYEKITLWRSSGSTITHGTSVQNDNAGTVTVASYIFITRVEGWKF